ncbi:MAG TPA: TraB/GumN family protein [Steroidobacteraceae bacterium]|jgi:hypothetical protein
MTARTPAGAWLLAALLLSGVCLGARADNAHHIFWEVRGKHNTVYLLGSVHMLKAGDSALPPEALRAYAASKGLVMELNLNDADVGALLGEGSELEMLPEGQSLDKLIGSTLWAQLLARMQPLGIDADTLNRFQPWFAALMLQQMELMKSGFEAASGVDEQLALMAQTDGKPIVGLETVDDQLGYFAHLSQDQQRQFLRSALDDSSSAGGETAAIVRAWQQGDTVALERLLREGSSDAPDVYRVLTTDRNRRWLPKIVALLNGDDNYLVVVGALHLIGHDGLVELLQHAGYTPIQH